MSLTLLLLLLLQDDPARLVEQLRSDDPAERKRAFLRLKELGASARTVLEKAKGDPDADVSGPATNLLGILDLREKFPPKFLKEHPEIVDRLATGDDGLWAETFDKVLETADVKVLDVLAPRAVRVRDRLGAENRLMIAGDLGLASALPELLRMARDKDESFRKAALTGLSMMASPTPQFWTFRFGRRGLEEPNEERNARIRRIARERLPELRKTLAIDDSDLRCRILNLLRSVQEKEAVPTLLDHLEDKSPDVRAIAVLQLIALQAPELVPAVMPLLKTIPERARIPLIEQIGNSGVREHIGALAEQLSHASPAIAGHSLVALARLRSEEHLPEIRRHLESSDGNLRWFAVRALGAWGDPKEAPALIKHLEDEDIQVRWAAIDALGDLGSEAALPRLQELSRSPHAPTRERAEKAVEKIRTRGGK